MKIRNIGLSTGLTLSVIAIVAGFLLIAMAESINFVSGGGGGGLALLMQWIGYWLMYGLGYLFVAAGIFNASATIIGWFFSKIYSLLSPQDKTKVQWGILILLVIGISMMAVIIHLRSQPEAIAQRAMEEKVQAGAKAEAEAAQEATEIKGANEKLQTMNELILGKWENEFNRWKPSLVFEEQGKLYTTHLINQKYKDSRMWSLSLNTKSPYYINLNSPYNIIENRSQASSRATIVALDAQQLILEEICSKIFGCDGTGRFKPQRETYYRVVKEERCQAVKKQIKGLWAVTDDSAENTHALFQEKDTLYYTNGVDWIYQGRWTLKCARFRSNSIELNMEIYIKTCPDCARHTQNIYISHLDPKQLMGRRYTNGSNNREKFTRSGIENDRELDNAILNLIALKQKEDSRNN